MRAGTRGTCSFSGSSLRATFSSRSRWSEREKREGRNSALAARDSASPPTSRFSALSSIQILQAGRSRRCSACTRIRGSSISSFRSASAFTRFKAFRISSTSIAAASTAIRKPLDYALYLAFFPQLLAGPIVRAGLFFGELFAWRPPGPDDVTYGLARAGSGW